MDSEITNEFIEQQKEKLLEMKEDILSRIEHEKKELDSKEKLADVNDSASAHEQKSASLIFAEHNVATIKRITQTLRRIDEGEYGYCEGCGGDVGLQRLKAIPTATHCIDCQSKAEHISGHHRAGAL